MTHTNKAAHGSIHAAQAHTFSRIAAWLERALVQRDTRLKLGKLDDEGLKDIGLTRDHVEADLGNYFSN
jgi:uncharacterized protein YjiS (DUF1127 family)